MTARFGCRRLVELLEEHGGKRVLPSDAVRFRAHASRCLPCRRRETSEVRLVRLEREALRIALDPALPESLVQAILHARRASVSLRHA